MAGVSGVVAEVVEDPRGFAALEEEWDDLHRHSPRATPFQSWAWLYSWWEHYGGGYELRLITVRGEGGLLVGAIPLMLERRWGLGRLLFVGTGPSDHLDVLVRRDWEAEACEAGVQALEQMDGWHVADLRELHPEAAAWALFECWSGRKVSVWQSQHPALDATKDWDQLLMSKSKRLRNNARRALRRAEADGVRCELVGAEEAREAAHRLVTVSREQWLGNPLTGPEHWTPRFKSHLETAARRMAAHGWGGISEWRRDGEVIISELLVFGPGYVGAYLVGKSRSSPSLRGQRPHCAHGGEPSLGRPLCNPM
jgi:CelD/BcsL family acetyltransferase involved in cellulose biosynthesis